MMDMRSLQLVGGHPQLIDWPNFTEPTPTLMTDGGEIGAGTVVRNRMTGDVGAVQGIGRRALPYAHWGIHDKKSKLAYDATPPALQDVFLKVDVWREGASRIWWGSNVEVMTDDD